VSRSVRAPGKAILCGEYAVLDGAPAIAIAVDRFVSARLGDGAGSPFVEAAIAHAERALGDAGAPAIARLRAGVAVDSTSLYEAGGKLGLGSSAAVTAAVVGLAFVEAGVGLDDRARIFAVADAAHAEAQGVAGSGIDVATAVFGGAIRFQRAPGQAPRVAPVPWPRDLLVTFLYSGQSASTPELVARVRRLAERDPVGYRSKMAALTEIAESFSAALERGDAERVVEAAARWQPQLAALGQAADAPIVTPWFEFLAATAAAHRCASKPSGAGGGDLAVVFGLSHHAGTLSRTLHHEGLRPLTLAGPAPGLSLENTP
jgi:phosphomevalonate kinase